MDGTNGWRVTARPARFFFFDGRAALFFPIMLFHLRPWTVALFVAVLLISFIIEKRGYTFTVALRILKLTMSTRGSFPRVASTHTPQSWNYRYQRPQ